MDDGVVHTRTKVIGAVHFGVGDALRHDRVRLPRGQLRGIEVARATLGERMSAYSLRRLTTSSVLITLALILTAARAVLTPWLKNYLRREKALQAHAKADPRRCVPGLNCLTVCGLRDGLANVGQFCIATRLGYALKGDVRKGLFFRGSEALPFGSAIRSVGELIDYLLTGVTTAAPGGAR